MPIRETACINRECGRAGEREEHYYPRQATPPQDCRECGSREIVYVSPVHILFTGGLGKYTDHSVKGWEKSRAEDGAHWAMRKNNLQEGEKPHAVYIDSLQAQREYCKAEGLRNPMDLTHEPAVGSDGKIVSSMGLPGAWS